MDEEQNQLPEYEEEPSKPSNPLKRAVTTGKTVFFKISKKVTRFFSSPVIPIPVKVGVILVIAIIVIIIALDADAEETSTVVTDTISDYMNSSDIDKAGKELFLEKASLMKMPLKDINNMYLYLKESNDFASTTVENYDYILGTKEIEDGEGGTTTNTANTDIIRMVEKAVAMAQKGNVGYNSNGRQLASTIDELDSMSVTDCSGLIWSLFKVYLGIDVGQNTDSMKSKAEASHSENGWTAEIHEIGDGSDLKPGDILYRDGHVGLYVGEYGTENHVDHGGQGSNAPGPNNSNYSNKGSSYTHYIRYTNPNASSGTAVDLNYNTTFTKGKDGRDDSRVEIITGSTNGIKTYMTGGKYVHSNGSVGGVKVNIVDVKANVWKSGGKSQSVNIQVNDKIAGVVKAMLDEIYNDPSHPVIDSIGGFRASDGHPTHVFGVAIDINPDQNPMPGQYGSIANYKPGSDSRSMDANHPIVKIIRDKYGWAWGGDFSTTKDYMHFSFIGG